jgi:uncharacterized protein (TIGR03066 family)
MKVLFAVLAALLVLAGSGRAADKIDAEKLLGKWEVTKGDTEAPKNAILEFAKEGKLMVSFELDGKKMELSGTYKIEEDKITLTLKSADGKEKISVETVKSLTDDMLVLEDKDGKKTEMTRKK